MRSVSTNPFGPVLPAKVAWFIGWALLALLVTLLAAAAAPAHAHDGAAVPSVSSEAMNSLLGRIAPGAVAAAAGLTAPRMTVEHTEMLDADRALAGNQGLDAYGRPLVELGGVTYRWWVTRGAARFGVGVGTAGYLVPSPDGTAAQTLSQPSSVLTLGWRFQVDDQSSWFADASGARRVQGGAAGDRYSGKVGVEWKSNRSKFGIDGVSRSLAMQLDSGYKMSLRVRKGGVRVVIKGNF